VETGASTRGLSAAAEAARTVLVLLLPLGLSARMPVVMCAEALGEGARSSCQRLDRKSSPVTKPLVHSSSSIPTSRSECGPGDPVGQ